MEKITSFTIDHIKLQPGVYVSRKDPVGDQVITTFDIRMTSPNEEPVMNTAELHAMEHLAATFLRNHKEFGPKVIYWGPMGCRTGNYLLLNGDYESRDIVPLMIEMFEFIRDFEGEIPGASPKDCGNYLDMNLGMAKYLAKKFLNEVLYDIKPDRLVYPQSSAGTIRWHDPCVLNGLDYMPKQKNRLPVSMYFIRYSCLFFIISSRYLQLKQDQDFPDLVKACSLCSTVLLLR